jgi:ATP-dependent Zn protease
MEFLARTMQDYLKNVGYTDGCQSLLSCKCFKRKYLITSFVEVAGIEPASERLQQIEPTCLSNPFKFREHGVRIGRGALPAIPLSLGQNPGA